MYRTRNSSKMVWDFVDDYSGDRYFKFKDDYFDLEQLRLDECFLTVTTENKNISPSDIHLYTLNRECVECPYLFVDILKNNVSSTNKKFRIATDYREYYPQDHTDSVICDLDPEFGQFGIYNINVENSTHCTVDVLKEPVNIYSPIFTVVLLHILVFGGMYVGLSLWQKWREKSQLENNSEKTASKKERVMSIDAFRGISIAIMIFANFGNGGYEFIHHSIWNGLHVADLVFPWFMWIMGACIPISLSSSFKRNVANGDILWNVLKRSVKLFLLGIFLNSGCDVYYIRIFGVLQRFGLCYCIVTTILVLTMNKDLDTRHHNPKLTYFTDIIKVWKAWLVSIFILIIHTVLTFCVAAPGCPRGYMGPGGLHKNISHENCIGGATGYIDRLILGNHVYQKPTIYEVYEAKPFDPEGIVGCLTTIFHVMLGVQAGVTLLVYKNHYERIIRWLIWSVILGLVGGGLCGFSKEDGLIPVNKNLWSLSFVLITCSFAFLLLSICYILIDEKKWWSGKPVLFAGMNAIILYIGHEMTDNHFPVRWYYSEDLEGNWRRTHFAALLSDTWAADFWVLVSYYLYKINYFFTV